MRKKLFSIIGVILVLIILLIVGIAIFINEKNPISNCGKYIKNISLCYFKGIDTSRHIYYLPQIQEFLNGVIDEKNENKFTSYKIYFEKNEYKSIDDINYLINNVDMEKKYQVDYYKISKLKNNVVISLKTIQSGSMLCIEQVNLLVADYVSEYYNEKYIDNSKITNLDLPDYIAKRIGGEFTSEGCEITTIGRDIKVSKDDITFEGTITDSGNIEWKN